MGDTYTQTINNMYSLESLQFSWLKSHLEQYYEKKYLNDYFDEGILEELMTISSSCHVYIGVWVAGYNKQFTKEEHDRINEGNRKYEEQLWAAFSTKDTMLRLWELNCEEIYSQYPIKAFFSLIIYDPELSGEEKTVHEKEVQDRVLEMIQAIQSETKDTCNLRVHVVAANGEEDLYDDARSWQYYILQGKQFEPEGEPNTSYEFAHAYAYEGIYW